MEFFRRARGTPSRLGILPGAFNPVTIAHVALARAASAELDEIVWVLPRALPHKEYTEGATFAQRIGMLCTIADTEPRWSVAASRGGLFLEIVEECFAVYGDQVRISFLCGRDAAERIAGWDYGQPDAFPRMLQRFDLLVASRGGEYQPPGEFEARIRKLPVAAGVGPVSASDVRGRIARGEPWKHLVPESIHEQVRKIY